MIWRRWKTQALMTSGGANEVLEQALRQAARRRLGWVVDDRHLDRDLVPVVHDDRVGPAAMAMMNLIAIALIAVGTFLLIVSMP
jgi:hypothetical protein